MWMLVIIAAVLVICAAGIYLLLKSMGESGVEAAAPGSCRRGRCGVDTGRNPQTSCSSSSSPPEATVLIDEITRKDARSPNQVL